MRGSIAGIKIWWYYTERWLCAMRTVHINTGSAPVLRRRSPVKRHSSTTAFILDNSTIMRFLTQTVAAFALVSAVLAAPTNPKSKYECLSLQ